LKINDTYSKLFSKYLSGNCSDEEKSSFEAWLMQSPENQAVFDEYKKVWNYSAWENHGLAVDVDAGWKELNKRIEAFELMSVDLHERHTIFNKKFIYIALRVAAVIILAFGLFYVFNTMNTSQAPVNVQYTATDIPELPIVLADGSEITLNKGAQITYPEEFTSDVRKINFEGEAFFNIAPDPEKPFIISAGELQIEVLGTSFNFCTCPDGENMVLYLEEGKVLFASVNTSDGSIREQLVLMPGQKGIFNKENGMIARSEYSNQNYLAWKTGVLNFEKAPLSEVLREIGQTYKLKIESDNSFETQCLTARFDNEAPESIFESLQTIFGIEYEFDGQTVVLK
jgi:ferric-dicitrate binding protein FerR (iron transport regulator)